ncbi:hypothetical protein CXC35_23310 [Salmonella enterica]|nr:hypothetical protein [Salmonella enterica]
MNPAKNFASAPGQLSREAVSGPPSERSTAGRNPEEVDGRRSFRSSEGAHERPVSGIRFISHLSVGRFLYECTWYQQGHPRRASGQ